MSRRYEGLGKGTYNKPTLPIRWSQSYKKYKVQTLLEVLTAVNQYYGREIDFEALDPEQMTVIGPLCRYISDEMAKS